MRRKAMGYAHSTVRFALYSLGRLRSRWSQPSPDQRRPSRPARRCGRSRAPDVRITAAAPAATPVPHCKVDGVIGKEIRFSVWLPDTWNGKFVMGGTGRLRGARWRATPW